MIGCATAESVTFPFIRDLEQNTNSAGQRLNGSLRQNWHSLHDTENLDESLIEHRAVQEGEHALVASVFSREDVVPAI